MLCPKCKSRTEVYDSRAFDATTRRGRRCAQCGHRFRTLEVVQGRKPRAVIARPVKKKTVAPSQADVVIVDFGDLSDEELEAAVYDDAIRFDEDEL